MTAPSWPDRDADATHAAVAEAWDLDSGWPLPHFDLVCPVCGSHDVGLKDWRFFTRPHSTIPHRCDVSAKCCSCSYVLTFGIPVPEYVHARHQDGRRYRWRTVRAALEQGAT